MTKYFPSRCSSQGGAVIPGSRVKAKNTSHQEEYWHSKGVNYSLSKCTVIDLRYSIQPFFVYIYPLSSS
ncbi:hypothetical protein ACN38_g5508 [Penicillium nordicum]|uniref:Uncharacterized protein n=1 Tax=Penicillium nordicum TaxID=229535 RepID=A0A0M9WG50_9EURO|nr:hypothetical protein ACN38_g5508 [Penicillium nordicum]